MFPKLTPSQMARMETHGRRTDMQAGQVLLEAGTRQTQVFVVVSGSIEVRSHDQANELLIFVLTAGDFSGEMSALRRSAGLATLRVRESGVAIAIDTEQIRLLVQTDAELSELLMRAFILRRVALISTGGGEITLLGSRHSADSLRLREFLTRNNQPFHYTEVEDDPDIGRHVRAPAYRRQRYPGGHLSRRQHFPQSQQPRHRRMPGHEPSGG